MNGVGLQHSMTHLTDGGQCGLAVRSFKRDVHVAANFVLMQLVYNKPSIVDMLLYVTVFDVLRRANPDFTFCSLTFNSVLSKIHVYSLSCSTQAIASV